jgi:hypothetical protein
MKFYLIFILDDEFVGDSDLLVACMVLQRQIEYTDRKKENKQVLVIQLKYIYERFLKDFARTTLVRESSSNTDVEISSSSQYIRTEMDAQDQRRSIPTIKYLCWMFDKREMPCLRKLCLSIFIFIM